LKRGDFSTVVKKTHTAKAPTFLFLLAAIFDLFSKNQKIGRACKSKIFKTLPLLQVVSASQSPIDIAREGGWG